MGDVIPFRRFKKPVPTLQVELLWCPAEDQHIEFKVGDQFAITPTKIYRRYFNQLEGGWVAGILHAIK